MTFKILPSQEGYEDRNINIYHVGDMKTNGAMKCHYQEHIFLLTASNAKLNGSNPSLVFADKYISSFTLHRLHPTHTHTQNTGLSSPLSFWHNSPLSHALAFWPKSNTTREREREREEGRKRERKKNSFGRRLEAAQTKLPPKKGCKSP